MLETDHLVTIFLALLDVGTGEVLLSSAGHPPPVHLSPAGATLIDIDSGPPLGAFERPHTVNRLHLAPGDALVLYTDGVTEARRGGAFFGEARLLRTLRGAGGRSPQLLVDVLRGAVDDFADRLTDDLDILAVRLVEQPVVVGIDSPDTAITT
jgi:sigma-B regulation protein RsbU (phosphoserine phosphatase)